ASQTVVHGEGGGAGRLRLPRPGRPPEAALDRRGASAPAHRGLARARGASRGGGVDIRPAAGAPPGARLRDRPPAAARPADRGEDGGAAHDAPVAPAPRPLTGRASAFL